MNKNLNPNHQKITQLLDRSAAQIEQPVLRQLHDARMQALVRYEARSASPVLAWAGAWRTIGSPHGSPHGSPQKIHFFAAAVLLIAFLLGAATYWNQMAGSDTSDIDTDIAILTDDLPMDIYID